jgi:hypothetical protein
MLVNNKVPKLKLLIVVDEDKQRDPRSEAILLTETSARSSPKRQHFTGHVRKDDLQGWT